MQSWTRKRWCCGERQRWWNQTRFDSSQRRRRERRRRERRRRERRRRERRRISEEELKEQLQEHKLN
jgi:hypothetical protein